MQPGFPGVRQQGLIVQGTAGDQGPVAGDIEDFPGHVREVGPCPVEKLQNRFADRFHDELGVPPSDQLSDLVSDFIRR